MSWRDAPLYVASHDLAVWLIERANRWESLGDRHLAPRVARAACSLVEATALALTFPRSRGAHLERADEAIVVLRTDLRLLAQLGLLSARGLRFACSRLREIGNMVGGWRKRVENTARRVARRESGEWSSLPGSGDGPPAAAGV